MPLDGHNGEAELGGVALYRLNHAVLRRPRDDTKAVTLNADRLVMA